MARITINGKVVSDDMAGRSIVVENNRVFIDGKEVDLPEDKEISIEVYGGVQEVRNVSGSITIHEGNADSVTTVSGRVNCEDVTGNVSTVSGNIYCSDIKGTARTVSGDIDKNFKK